MHPLSRHTNVVLQFSGGKDSIALLKLLSASLKDITVLWMNTGAAFPETLQQMEEVRKLCPRFVEVVSDQPRQIEANGYPSDMLPVRNHVSVQHLTGQTRLPLQGFLECCQTNLMQPMHKATLELGATLIIRGQKNADHQKSPYRSGSVINGVELWYPLEDWTDEQVRVFVQDSSLLPKHYEQANTSLDCWSCTAYLEENQWKLPYLEKYHPEKGAEVRRRLILIKKEIMAEVNNLGVCDG